MARDFEGMYDPSSMTDGELRELITDQLNDYGQVDPDTFDVRVEGGRVTLSGRVGTEQEVEAIEQVVLHVLGVSELDNQLIVDELRRSEQPEAADEATAERVAAEGNNAGGANRTEDTAEHLMADTASEQFGTSSTGEAIERGYSYNPPTSPTQEGTLSREDH